MRGVDIVARHDDEVIAVELKRRFGIDLLLQAVQRQKTTDSVYVAVPARPDGPAIRNYRRVAALLRRLELGLIVVHFRPSGTKVEVRLHPARSAPRSSRRERRNILREFDGRTGDRNTGGSTRRRVITAYREQAVFIACALECLGSAAPAELRMLGTGEKTQSILSKNYYGWFERVGHGRYSLHEAGRAGLKRHPDLANHYAAVLRERNTPGDSQG